MFVPYMPNAYIFEVILHGCWPQPRQYLKDHVPAHLDLH